MDFDIKEFRLAEMKRTINPKTASLSTLDAMNKLAEEVKIQGTHYLPTNNLQLNQLLALLLHKASNYKSKIRTVVSVARV